jgi:drug/metabolite transporter (DMT)-like permease
MRRHAGHRNSGGIIGRLAAYSLIIAAVLLEGMAQLAFKRGTSAAQTLAPGGGWRYWRGVATSPWIAAGVALYVVEILCWLGALHDVPLSIAFPALSLNYVVVVLGAHWLLGERVDRRSALAIGLIVAGVTLVVAPVWPD